MYQAYNEGKDLYAMIAQSAFDNEYWENLEFYPAGTEVELDGKQTVSGSGKEWEEKLDDQNKVTVNYYELLETVDGDKAAETIQIGEKILSDTGELTVINKEQDNDKITFTFAF